MLANNAPRPAEEHRGYEITYVAVERSWYIRADADAPLSRTTTNGASKALAFGSFSSFSQNPGSFWSEAG